MSYSSGLFSLMVIKSHSLHNVGIENAPPEWNWQVEFKDDDSGHLMHGGDDFHLVLLALAVDFFVKKNV
jgi:hypothetical protein